MGEFTGRGNRVVARARRRVLTANRATWLALTLDARPYVHAYWVRRRFGYEVVVERRVPDKIVKEKRSNG